MAELEALARKYNGVLQYPSVEETQGYTHVPDELCQLGNNDADAQEVVAAVDAMQRLCMARCSEEMIGEVTVQKRRYAGFCNGELAGRAVEIMREYVQRNEGVIVGGVFVRGMAEDVQCWKRGRWRGGGTRGFDGDIGEMFLWRGGGKEWVVQMRAAVDEVG